MGHLHNSGIPSYNDSFAIGIKSTSGVLYVFTHTGHMAGFLTGGSRDDNWDVTGQSTRLAAAWTDVEGGQFYWRVHVDADLNGLIIELGTLAGVVLPIDTVVLI